METFFLDCGFSKNDADNYSSLFQQNCIEKNQFSSLNHELLREMGINVIGHRIKYKFMILIFQL